MTRMVSRRHSKEHAPPAKSIWYKLTGSQEVTNYNPEDSSKVPAVLGVGQGEGGDTRSTRLALHWEGCVIRLLG